MGTNLKNIKSRKNDTEWCNALIKSVGELKKDGCRFETYKELKSEKQLDSALKKYGKGLDFTDVLMMLDETLSLSGKKGFILTADAVYSSHCDPIVYENLISAKADTLNFTVILEYADGTVRSEKIGLWAEEVCDALQKIIKLQNIYSEKSRQQPKMESEEDQKKEKIEATRQNKSDPEKNKEPSSETKKSEQKKAEESDLAAYIRQVKTRSAQEINQYYAHINRNI